MPYTELPSLSGEQAPSSALWPTEGEVATPAGPCDPDGSALSALKAAILWLSKIGLSSMLRKKRKSHRDTGIQTPPHSFPGPPQAALGDVLVRSRLPWVRDL